MKGSIRKRYEGSYSLIIDVGYEPIADATGTPVLDPKTGKQKLRRKQKWIVFRPDKTKGNPRKQAEAKLAEILHGIDRGTYVEPSKTTVIEYLRDWVEKAAKPPLRREETYRVYTSIIECHIAKSSIAHLTLQKLRTSHLEQYYGSRTHVSAASLRVHHAILNRALRQAVRDHLLPLNPATAVENRRTVKKTDAAQHAQRHCWTAEEARAVLTALKTARAMLAAFGHLALDTGARKSELYGLTWDRVDLDAGTVRIDRQLDGPGPVFGPTKTDRARTITLNAQTVARLKAHKRAQAELRMRNRTTYQDVGLVFAREPEDLTTPTAALGQPFDVLHQRFQRVVKDAGVRRIKFHGVRHTCTTLLLQAGVPVHVVAQRLGHANPMMTLSVYAHVLPSMQADAAAKLGALLHG